MCVPSQSLGRMIAVVLGDLRVILRFIQVTFFGSAFHFVTAASLAVLIILLRYSSKNKINYCLLKHFIKRHKCLVLRHHLNQEQEWDMSVPFSHFSPIYICSSSSFFPS